jgi:hypothetical protein
MLTGFWPPSNEMLRKFSTAPNQNPGGWQGQNWEGRGYDVYAYFPEFPGGVGSNPKGNGDFEVDYQDVSSDFWRITDNIHPVAILSYGQGAKPWEIEYNARNLSGWDGDYLYPRGPTPSPPDNSVPAGYVRNSTLPVQAIADAINSSGAGVNAWVDWDGDTGAFLCEYMAYHDAWYQSLHSDPCDQYSCLAAGFTHVSGSLSISTATTACEIALRATINYLDSQLTPHIVSGTITSDGLPLAGVIINGLPGNPVTDANGFYTAKVGAGWSGTVAPIKEGYAFNPAERTYNNVKADQPSQEYSAYSAISQTIEFDATSSFSSSVWSNTLSWSHTIGSGNNRVLVIAAASGDNLAMSQVINSVTYNGVNMTKVPASSKSRGYIKADLYYMLEANLPSSPGTYTVSITYNGTVSSRVGGAVSLRNVKQQVPEAVVTNSLASATAISTNINTLSNGAWIVDAAGLSKNGSFSTSTSAKRWNQSSGIHTGAGSTTVAASAGSNTISWNFSGNSGTMLHSLAAFAPAQTAAPATNPLTITATAGTNGTINPAGQVKKDYGQNQQFTAVPNNGCTVQNWYLDGTIVQSGGTIYTLTDIQADHTIHVTFKRLPYDDFNNNRLDNAIWQSFADDYDNVRIVEDVNRLNIRAVGMPDNLVADYTANGWSIDANENFRTKVDFHYSSLSIPAGWVEMTIENSRNNYVLIAADANSNETHFWYEQVVDGNAVSFGQVPRYSNDGTLYISYDAVLDELYLSHTGYGAADAWQTIAGLLQGRWAAKPVIVAIGGGSNGCIIADNQAYLDNFEVTAGKVLGWPPPRDLNSDRFIDRFDMKVMSEHWLQTGIDTEGDVNGDGTVNFIDFALLATAQ